MSDKILKALMQLFAIIGKYETEKGAARRKMEEQFLKQTLNEDQAQEYLKIYDDFIRAYNSQEPDIPLFRKMWMSRKENSLIRYTKPFISVMMSFS